MRNWNSWKCNTVAFLSIPACQYPHRKKKNGGCSPLVRSRQSAVGMHSVLSLRILQSTLRKFTIVTQMLRFLSLPDLFTISHTHGKTLKSKQFNMVRRDYDRENIIIMGLDVFSSRSLSLGNRFSAKVLLKTVATAAATQKNTAECKATALKFGTEVFLQRHWFHNSSRKTYHHEVHDTGPVDKKQTLTWPW